MNILFIKIKNQIRKYLEEWLIRFLSRLMLSMLSKGENYKEKINIDKENNLDYEQPLSRVIRKKQQINQPNLSKNTNRIFPEFTYNFPVLITVVVNNHKFR